MNGSARPMFLQWMTAYGKASAENDAQASADLFTEDAEYYVSPFDEPITGRDAIHAYWRRGAQTLEDKQSTYQILSVEDNLGIASWQSSFVVKESGKRFALDCLFVVEFNDEGLCRRFREWWHLRETDLVPRS
jgi:ketosteroid isomerase-like protein